MAYDKELAARVRRAFGKVANVVEKPMFGGLTFMVGGNLCCGVLKDELMIRLDRDTNLATLDSSFVRVCDLTSRPMRGLFVVSAAGCSTQRGVNNWIRHAIDHARTLRPK